jgi:antitoxin component YwqK of YwqJK toxin-antitoxin module
MRSIILISFVGILQNSFAQKFIESYYNYGWKEVVSIDEASYYGYALNTDSGWYRMDFILHHPKNKIQMSGLYKDKENKIKNGVFKWYYFNGNLKTYGKYIENRKEGLWLNWYSNGSLADSLTYKDGQLVGINKSWYKNDFLKDSLSLDENGNGIYTAWFDDSSPSEAGRYKNYKKNGVWTYFHKNGKISSKEIYRMDTLISFQLFNEEGNLQNDSIIPSKEPEFKGGERAWNNYCLNNIHFPGSTQLINRDNVVVSIEFTINEEGKVEDVELVIPVHEVFDKKVIQFMKESPQWTPAINHNRRVKYQSNFSVTFSQHFN